MTPTCLHRAALLLLCGLFALSVSAGTLPTFSNVSVHDPSVIRANNQYYVFGSHLAAASTTDWMHWTQIAGDSDTGGPLVPHPEIEFAEAEAWTGTNGFWAPVVIQLGDGRYYYYYCISRLDSPRAALGLAVSDSVTGPYTNLGLLLKSGMWGLPSADGTIYDPTKHPNTVDPDVFFDKSGRLWMVYGSYSGGIFILQLDPSTGVPLPNQGYGKKLIGGNHARIEGPFILYSPDTDYYYLFMSWGGFGATGGYNIRVGRSRNPDGPYYDAAGHDLTPVSGAPGSLFDDVSIAPYGVKLMGNYQFLHVDGEPGTLSRGYLSPGGNSAYYDPASHHYFVVFHTRFVGRGEEHEVRVHELFLNEDGWFVASPQRYAGPSPSSVKRSSIAGDYKLINHGKTISADVNTSVLVTLNPNHTVTGAATGSWSAEDDREISLTLGNVTYRGVTSIQWDDDNNAWVYTFSALSDDGVSIWGSKTVIAQRPPVTMPQPNQTAYYRETTTIKSPRPTWDQNKSYAYTLLSGPVGLSVARDTGVATWKPMLSQVDQTYSVTIVAVDTSAEDPKQTIYTYSITARSRTVIHRTDLNFSTASTAGIQDATGLYTGFNARLPGTGTTLPLQDPKLSLDPASGVLNIKTSQADFNGRAGLPSASAPGFTLASLGFTGAEDFSVTAVFRSLPALEFIDQVGLYIGSSSDSVTRAGTIVFANPERYSTHSQNGADNSGHFFGFGFDGSDGMTVTISREAGVWRYFVDGVEWNPLSPTTFLDSRADLVAGVFAVSPLNANSKTVQLDSFSAIVATNQPQ